MDKRIRILILYSGYWPAKTYGGPVNSISNIVEYLGDKFEFYIITSDHELRSSKRLSGIQEGWSKVGKAKVLYLSNKELEIKNMQNKIEQINPDIIYLNSVFLYKFLITSIKYKQKHKAKIIITPRGELCENALKIKKLKKEIYLKILKYFKLNEKVYWQATSKEEELAIQKKLNVPEYKIQYVEVLPQKVEIKSIKKKKEKDILKCVFISRICEKKNLINAIKYVKKANTGITLDIYGFIEDLNYWQKCKKEIGKNQRIKYCGILEPKDVIKTFQKYHLFIFPTYSENYGHVIAEAMIGGCPVILSDQTPWKDIKEKKVGEIIKLGDDLEFIKKLNEMAKLDEKQYQELQKRCETYINNKIQFPIILNKYERMFNIKREG